MLGASALMVAVLRLAHRVYSDAVGEPVVTLVRHHHRVQAEEPKKPFAYRPEDFHPERLPKGDAR